MKTDLTVFGSIADEIDDLDGCLQCPKCSGTELSIGITGVAIVAADGTTAYEDISWEEESPATCTTCGYVDVVRGFEFHPIPNSGEVNLLVVKSMLEWLGFEVTMGTTGVPETYIEVETARGTTSLWCHGRDTTPDVRTLTLTNDAGTTWNLGRVGPRTHRQVAALVGLTSEHGFPQDSVATWRLREWPNREWTWDGWDSEEEECDDGRPGVDFLTIREPDGGEVAVIIDRSNVLIGDLDVERQANLRERRARKEAYAKQIVDAMNRSSRGAPDPG